jgi:CRP/FNR family transcriptional regulator, cyclic AMP receptor protein
MGHREDKNTFLVVSGDKPRISKITEVLGNNFTSCTVFHAVDWFETKYKIDNVRPKIVLIDEYLPKGSGIDLVHKILKEKNNNDIFIVIMSYVADHDMFSSEVASGRISFLTEPDKDRPLIDCISKIIKPKQAQNQAQYRMRHLSAGEVLFKEGDDTQVAYIF